MKTRLVINIDGCPLRFLSLYKFAYSDGANLILSYLNASKECCLGFRRLFVFHTKSVHL